LGDLSVVKFIGNININQRLFLKGAKHPQKITINEDGTIRFSNSNTIIRQLNTLLTDLGYPQTLIDEITNVINIQSVNPNIKTYKGDWDETRQGIVNF
jgi:hypothetical protein